MYCLPLHASTHIWLRVRLGCLQIQAEYGKKEPSDDPVTDKVLASY